MPRRLLTLLSLLAIAAMLPAPSFAGNSVPEMDIKLDVSDGRKDKPMIVVWLEKTNGRFVKTIRRFSKAKKYYKDLTLSFKLQQQAGESKAQLDAITGATISWNQSRSFKLPVEINGRSILTGKYVLRIESMQDMAPKIGGKHYKRFGIPLKKGFKGGTITHNGYVARVTIQVPKSARSKFIPVARKPRPSGPSRSEKSAASLVKRAKSAERRKDFSAALRLYKSASKRYASTDSGKAAKARATEIMADSPLMSIIQKQDAVKKIKRLLARARSWEANGLKDKAVADYRQVATLAPGSPEAERASARLVALAN